MQSIFLSPIDIQSPRWSQAFPQAVFLNSETELPNNLHGSMVWVLLSREFSFSQISKYVASGARVIALTQH